jgi:hypothetical protein
MSPMMYVSSSRPPHYVCDSCGKDKTGMGHPCYVCRKKLCPECNTWGLCPDHFAQLLPSAQNNLQVLDRDFERADFIRVMPVRRGGIALVVFALVSYFVPLSLGKTHYATDYALLLNIMYALMWGPGLLLVIRAFWKSWHNRPAHARATLALTRFFEDIPAFDKIDWKPTEIHPEKALALLRSRGLLPSDVSIPLAGITLPLTVANDPNAFKGTTERCWTCGAPITVNNVYGCFQCGALLCPQCHNSGLCPAHFAALAPQQQADLKTCFETRQQAQKDYGRPWSQFIIPLEFIWAAGIIASMFIGLSWSTMLAQSIIIALISLTFIVGVGMKVKLTRLKVPLDRANIAIKTLLDDIPALAQIRPVYHPVSLNSDDAPS